MIAAKSSPDEIVIFIVKSRAAFVAGKKTVLTISTPLLLDEIDPRSAFKELKNYLKRQLAK